MIIGYLTPIGLGVEVPCLKFWIALAKVLNPIPVVQVPQYDAIWAQKVILYRYLEPEHSTVWRLGPQSLIPKPEALNSEA